LLLSRSARLPVTPADAARPIGSLRADLVRGFAECADKRVTIVRVTYVPGGYTPSHRHAVSVIPYVTAETIRSQFAGGPVETFKVVESFFEYVHPTLAAVAHRLQTLMERRSMAMQLGPWHPVGSAPPLT